MEFISVDSAIHITCAVPHIVRTVLASFVILCAHALWKRRANDNLKLLPPGSSGWPVIGETLPFVVNGRTYFQSRIRKYGLVFRTHLINCPTVVVCGSKHVRHILNGEGDIVTHNPTPSSWALFGRSLGNITGDKHHEMHRIVRRAFKYDALNRFTPRMHQILRDRVDKWHACPTVNGVNEMKQVVFELGTEVILGMSFDNHETHTLLKQYELFADNFFSLPIDIHFSGFHRAKEARKNIISLLQDRIGKKSDCIFDTLYGQIDDSICDIILEVMFAMTSTTSSTLCALIKQLTAHPWAIEAVRNEVLARMETEGVHCHRDLSFTDLTSRHPVVNAVVKETLRLNPPVAGGFRKAIRDFYIDGYLVPAGWRVLYCITDTHEQAPDFSPTFSLDRWTKDHGVCTKGKDQITLSATKMDVVSSVEQQTVKHSSTCVVNEHQASRECCISCPTVTSAKRDGESATNFEEDDKREKDKSNRYDYIPFGAGNRTCPGQEFGKQVLRLATIELCMSSTWILKHPDAPVKTSPIPFPSDDMIISIYPR